MTILAARKNKTHAGIGAEGQRESNAAVLDNYRTIALAVHKRCLNIAVLCMEVLDFGRFAVKRIRPCILHVKRAHKTGKSHW